MMEYQGQGWLDLNSNSGLREGTSSPQTNICVCSVCDMDGDLSLKSVYKGKTYYF